MKVSIEMRAEYIPALENWVADHGGTVIEKDSEAGFVRMAVLSAGPYWIKAVAAFREETGLSLVDSKGFVVDNNPLTMMFSEEKARQIRKRLVELKAVVKIFEPKKTYLSDVVQELNN